MAKKYYYLGDKHRRDESLMELKCNITRVKETKTHACST